MAEEKENNTPLPSSKSGWKKIISEKLQSRNFIVFIIIGAFESGLCAYFVNKCNEPTGFNHDYALRYEENWSNSIVTFWLVFVGHGIAKYLITGKKEHEKVDQAADS